MPLSQLAIDADLSRENWKTEKHQGQGRTLFSDKSGIQPLTALAVWREKHNFQEGPRGLGNGPAVIF